MEKITKSQSYLEKSLGEELEYYLKRANQLKCIIQNVKNHNSLEEFIKKAKMIDTFDDSWIDDMIEEGKRSKDIIEDNWTNSELLIANEPYLYDIYDDENGNSAYVKCFINHENLYKLEQEFEEFLNKDQIERKDDDDDDDEFIGWLSAKGYQIEIINRPGAAIHIEDKDDEF